MFSYCDKIMADNNNDTPDVSLIVLVVVFYVVGFAIALYIRISKILLIKKIKKTGRVISLSQTIISMLMQQLQEQQHQRPQISPATGLPAPPPYTIQAPEPPPIEPDEQPPPYVELPPYQK